jgi:hypothetical protein
VILTLARTNKSCILRRWDRAFEEILPGGRTCWGMARAIVKFSPNTPKGQAALSNAPRAAARGALEASGVFHGAGTLNLHAEGQTQQDLFAAVQGMFHELGRAQPPVTVDHVWFYFDNEPGPESAGEVVEDIG